MTDQKWRPHTRSRLSLVDSILLERPAGLETAMPGKQRKGSLTDVIKLDKWPAKHFKGENDDITFSDSDAHLIHHSHYDALVITAMMGNNNVYRILVDDGSLVDILYYQAFQKMGLKVSDLKPSSNLVYGFTGDSVTPTGVISLPMTILCDG